MKKKKNKKPIVIIIVLLLLAAAAVLFFFKKKQDMKPKYTLGTAQTGDISTSVTIKGLLKGREEYKVYSDSACKVKNIPVKKGDVVRKDQVLAVMDDDKLRQQYDMAMLDYESARKNYENLSALYESGSVSPNVYEEAERALQKAELLCQTYDIENAGEVTSPADGTVTEINCSEGGYASLSAIQQPAFVIEDRSEIVLKADAKEKYMSSIYIGQSAEITSEAMGGEGVTGRVTEIAPAGRVNQSNGTVVVPVTVEIDSPSPEWMTGVTGKAKLLLSAEGVLTVPIDAVSEKNDETCVYVCSEGNEIKKIPVETGIDDDNNIEIVSGDLKAGDQVIIDPDSYMLE